ncbi:unnamed protein product [Ceutorhynchus assimilis]|uniref:WD repeat and HMG-box DNA-binding protein 1 n=1 Tax=Ceutorhynchus assimilis TaxID=467358 RepID=A0A9N9QN21_9CUCU|nr:unnamed protein product [Ceutorhynchus assimilis]
MNIIHEPLRYAHEEGHTDVCYSVDGQNFITCGSDGDIRIWSVDEGEDPHHTCIGEWALSVRQKGDKIYVSTGSNEIQILSLPEGERDGVLTRATDPFNQIALCKNKNFAALAGEGMEVSIMDLETNTLKTSFKELGGPCLSVAICPNAVKVAASTGDGKLHIWDIESSMLLKELTCFSKVNSFANAKNLCRLEFDPKDGSTLAYPEKNTIKLLNTKNWAEETLNCNEITADFSILNYSSCGKYLAAASVEGDFVIWETGNKNVFKVTKHESSKAICGLMWNPTGNGEIVYTDIEGQLSIMSHCARLQRVDVEKKDAIVDEHGFEENEVDFGDMIEDNEIDSVVRDLDRPTSELEFKGSSSKSSSRASSPSRPRTPEIPLQASFMPTSSPDHLDPRYLCWNDIGIVKSYGGNNAGDDVGSKSIEVEFHDTSFHNSMMLQNFQEYTMGSIGKGALVVANSSQIMVIPLAVGNKEWSLKVEEYEDIILVAASENLVCFATTNYLVRVCSIFGTQRAMVSVPGPLVCMSAFKNVLMVAYHAGGIRNGDQCINVKLFKFEGLNVECLELGSALGPESTLYWLGFSDVGTPGMMDSLGMLSLFPPKCNTWIPYCDTTKHRKNPGDAFFVTTVFESYQAIGGIRCKGTIYPSFIPRPTVCELPINAPFAESSTDKTQMEMDMFSWSNLNIMDTDRKYKETALKIFALACKNDLDQRAFEFMQIISNQQILNLGLKYTTKLNKKRLADKLIELASRLQEDGQEEEEPSRTFHSGAAATEISTPEVVIKPKPMKFRLSKSTHKISTPLRKQETETTEETTNQSTNENNLSAINTQESLFSEAQSFTEEPSQPKNPFLKKPEIKPNEDLNATPDTTLSWLSGNPFLKKAKKPSQASPLSLTDKFAGVDYNKPETKQQNVVEAAEKRKLSPAAEKPIEKQRKLDKFMFSKR